MSTDKLLNQLLSYHQILVDSQFVEKVMSKIDRTHFVRQWILSIAVLLGIVLCFFGLNILLPGQWSAIETQWDHLAPVVATIMILGVFVFMFWLLNDELETI